MKIKLNLLSIPILALLLMILGGCSNIKTPLTQGELTKEALNNTESLLTVQRIATAKANNYGKHADKFTAVFNKRAKAEEKKVSKSLKTLEGTEKFKGYPSEVYNYSKSALAYIRAVATNQKIKIVNKKYHEATKDAIKVATDTKSKKIRDYVTSVVSNDTYMQAKVDTQPITKKNKNKQQKKNKNIDFNSYIKKASKTGNSQINITYGWGTLIIVVSVLLITSVFLQPNRSEDNSDALTNEALKPKPRGFDLLMLRSTEGLIIVLVLIMILMNQK